MAALVTCPACGKENSLNRKFDAWAYFQILGLDENGELILSDDCDTQVFDDSEFECSSCERQFDQDEIVDHLLDNDSGLPSE